MIAGALAAYRRGPTIGTRTYGKGCAQEYVDDDAHVGMLRLTTLLYALPDGSPVQRVGLTPTIELLPTSPHGDDEREATLAHAPPTWRGPDVRDRTERWDVPWPSSAGGASGSEKTVGPCAGKLLDEHVCKALAAVSGWTSRRTIARQR
jgi:carboxyl-terminal processing protease